MTYYRFTYRWIIPVILIVILLAGNTASLGAVEQEGLAGAERHLRTALKTDPDFPEAAYNLAILVSKENLDESVRLCRKAHDLRPRDAKYAYTLAFYLQQKGKLEEAIAILQKLVQQQPNFTDAGMLLRALYEQQKTPKEQ